MILYENANGTNFIRQKFKYEYRDRSSRAYGAFLPGVGQIKTNEVLQKNRAEIEDELADVLMGVCAFANASGIDLATAFERKLAKAKIKYPVEQCKGRSDKYTLYV